MKNFRPVTIEPFRRELNSRADGLAKGAATGEYMKKTELIMMENMTEGKRPEKHYKINAIDIGDGTDEKDDWMKEVTDFLQELILPEDKINARKIRLKAIIYAIIGNMLYRKSFSGPLLR